jgi:hypothetical protein
MSIVKQEHFQNVAVAVGAVVFVVVARAQPQVQSP